MVHVIECHTLNRNNSSQYSDWIMGCVTGIQFPAGAMKGFSSSLCPDQL